MADAEPRRIDWSSAVVEDGTLEVELSGSDSKRWRAHFERVLALLESPHSRWAEVSAGGRLFRVKGVAEGAEDELRHFLESAVIEANSDLQDGSADRTAVEPPGADPAAERDRRMTEAFRHTES